VRSVALRAVNLSREGIGTISDMIDVIARRERELEQNREKEREREKGSGSEDGG
jgi:hypothetical protein